jgi:hypothetical protein
MLLKNGETDFYLVVVLVVVILIVVVVVVNHLMPCTQLAMMNLNVDNGNGATHVYIIITNNDPLQVDKPLNSLKSINFSVYPSYFRNVLLLPLLLYFYLNLSCITFHAIRRLCSFLDSKFKLLLYLSL